ncbi:MAG: hypothetical protein MPJ24_06805 [Pirellulaceae bacterium]|nr:hypothetical protein [Pirellulaceae bacterium]
MSLKTMPFLIHTGRLFAICYSLLFLGSVAVFTGCTAVSTPKSQSDLLFEGKGEALAANVPQYLVEMKNSNGDTSRYQGAINETTTLQKALADSGAVKKFSRMKVHILRKGATGKTERLNAEFDHFKQKVKIASDYHLHSGDRIVVVEDTRTVFDDVLEAAIGKQPFVKLKQ